jgi:hypothetical protein
MSTLVLMSTGLVDYKNNLGKTSLLHCKHKRDTQREYYLL